MMLGISACVLIGCSRKQPPAEYVAKIDGEMLIQKQIETLHPEYERRSYINAWVNETLLFLEAQKNGLGDDERIREQLQAFRRQLLIQRLLENEVYLPNDTAMNEDTLRSYFNTHRKEFLAAVDQVILSGIVFRLRDEANKFRNKILRGNAWETQIEISKNRNTEIVQIFEKSFFTKQTIPSQEMWNVVLSLRSGAISFPIATGQTFAIVRVDAMQRKGEVSPFNFVRDEIRQRLVIAMRKQRYEEFLHQLKNKYSVDVQTFDIPGGK